MFRDFPGRLNLHKHGSAELDMGIRCNSSSVVWCGVVWWGGVELGGVGFSVVGWGWLEIYMFPLCKSTCMGVRYVANRSFDSMEFWILCGLLSDGVNSFKNQKSA